MFIPAVKTMWKFSCGADCSDFTVKASSKGWSLPCALALGVIFCCKTANKSEKVRSLIVQYVSCKVIRHKSISMKRVIYSKESPKILEEAWVVNKIPSSREFISKLSDLIDSTTFVISS